MKVNIIDNNILLFNCPHCKELIQVNIKDLNCHIFRHAVYKNSGKQINPHSCKEKCDALVKKNLVFGCAKPFRIDKIGENFIVNICDYI